MAKLHHIDNNESLEASTIEAALEAKTEFGKEFIRQFRAALLTKKTTKIGDYNLQDLLNECFAARDNKTLCEEYDLKEKYPEWASMPVSIVSFKVGILVALLRENLVDVAKAPFIVDPTPKPTIPEEQKNRILDELMEVVTDLAEEVTVQQQMFVDAATTQGVSPTDAMSHPQFPTLDPDIITELVRVQKIKVNQQVKDHAQEQALLLQRDLYDKTTEGGYKKAIMEFVDDFATYPFGCIHGPFPTVKTETVWSDNKFKEEDRVVWAFERVSPFDLFWTEDSSNTQDGSAVFIRKRVGYDYLYNARKLAESDDKSGYDFKVIDDLITQTNEGNIPRHWTEFDVKNPEHRSTELIWSRGSNVEILIRYGRSTGKELFDMGFASIDKDRLYETKSVMCAGQVIHCQINKNPSQYKRPVYTASFENRNGGIAGIGLGQKLLPLHRAYRAVVHLAMYNLGLSSEPITEVEATRVLQYMPDEWINEPTIAPGMVIPADGDRMGNGSRAIKFTQIPNMTDSGLRLASYIFDLSHVVSNIPAALHGQPVGSGANRTVRGLLTLQGNTLKPILSSMVNLDTGVVEPMVTLLYMLLVMYDEGFEYSGDCKIIAKGAASMVEREMEKQTAMENLQIVGQLGDNVNPDVHNRVVKRLLVLAGVLEPGEDVIAPPIGKKTPEPTAQGQVPQGEQATVN